MSAVPLVTVPTINIIITFIIITIIIIANIISNIIIIMIASIGQTIMQANPTPHKLCRLIYKCLKVQLYVHFYSRFFIDSLHAHGFCCPYEEVAKFQCCSTAAKGTYFP